MERGPGERSPPSAAGGQNLVDRATFRLRTRADFAFLFVILLGAAGSCPAADTAGKADTPLPEVIIAAKRQAADEQVTQQVEQTLDD